MYLSRIKIDRNNRQKMKDLTHLGAFHNWVEKSFPNEINHGKRLRHLWRIDKLNGEKYLLIVSDERPDIKELIKYGVENTAEIKDYGPYISKLHNNQLLYFRLTANPTYRTDGKVYPHITIEQQKNWLLKRSEREGFRIISDQTGKHNFDVTSRDWPILYHKRQVRLSRVTFEGILRITDKLRLEKALTQGIGREKAYGMGMLTVIPVEGDQ